MILKQYHDSKIISPTKNQEPSSPIKSLTSNDINFVSPTHSTIHEGTDEKTFQSHNQGALANTGQECTLTYSSQDEERTLVFNQSLLS